MSGISEHNPYVGPRPFARGEPLYGRSREIDELYDRLQSRRIVVMHSPSGAGKSSLVQAGLIPKLEQARFDVWPPIRVNMDPAQMAMDEAATVNRYVLSVLLSLEAELPEAHRRGPEELAPLSLIEYLQTRPRRKRRAGRPVVLIFDQFEEILTVAPLDIEAKRGFFDALGEALNTGDYWALFTIRDDFLAGLAPYADRVPTGLNNRFRLDLLGLEGAREAAEQPAIAGGREFPGVDKLIADLSAVKIQQADGSFATEQGIYVEPVQLQVVCRQLWDAMPPDDRIIDERDIEDHANVSDSLAAYYAEAVYEAAAGDIAAERAVRDWVGTKLIVGGIRSQVRQGAADSGGLDNARIDVLRDSYLVRAEFRAGANWFELSHDRLVEPVQRDNKRWEKRNLHPLQIQARMWASAETRSASLLLRGDALDDAIAWAAQNDALLTDTEREYLELSKKARVVKRRTTVAVMAAIALLVIGILAMGVLLRTAIRAKYEASIAEIDAMESAEEARAAQREAQKAREIAVDATMIAAVRELFDKREMAPAAFLLARIQHPEQARGWSQFALDVLAAPMMRARLVHERRVVSVAWSPDGATLLTASIDGSARLWTTEGEPLVTLAHTRLESAAWSPDGERVATQSPRSVRLWTRDGALLATLASEGAIAQMDWSPDAAHLAARIDADAVQVWSTDEGEHARPLRVPLAAGLTVRDLDWSPDGVLVTTTAEQGVLSWRLDDGAIVPVAGPKSARAIAWSSDGATVATLSFAGALTISRAEGGGGTTLLRDDAPMTFVFSPDGSRVLVARGALEVWSTDEAGAPLTLDAHAGELNAMIWSPDGSKVATASEDGRVRVWVVHDESVDAPVVFAGHEVSVQSIAWSPDGSRLASASTDRTARIWSADGRMPLELDHESTVLARWSPDGRHVLSASDEAGLRVWTLSADNSQVTPVIAQASDLAVVEASWSPDSGRIVATLDDRSVRLWTLPESEPLVLVEPTTERLDRQRPHAAWSPDGSEIVTSDEHMRVWKADGSDRDPRELSSHPYARVAWSPDGERILSASDDGLIIVARVDGSDRGDPVLLSGHQDELTHAAWSPDSRRILSTSDDTTVRVWQADGSDRDDPILLTGHAAPIEYAAWSPEGAAIVSVSNDGSARVWTVDGPNRDDPLVLAGHDDLVETAQWSPDGQRILTSSRDGVTRVWAADGSDRDDPLVLDSAGRAQWSPDGKRILGLERDATRVWFVDPAILGQRLRDATPFCPSVEQRRTYLQEDRAEALANHLACERKHGRHRFDAQMLIELVGVETTLSGEVLEHATEAVAYTIPRTAACSQVMDILVSTPVGADAQALAELRRTCERRLQRLETLSTCLSAAMTVDDLDACQSPRWRSVPPLSEYPDLGPSVSGAPLCRRLGELARTDTIMLHPAQFGQLVERCVEAAERGDPMDAMGYRRAAEQLAAQNSLALDIRLHMDPSGLQRCYRDTLSASSPRRSRLGVDVVIGEDGVVRSATIVDALTDVGSAQARACMTDALVDEVALEREAASGEIQARLTIDLSWR